MKIRSSSNNKKMKKEFIYALFLGIVLFLLLSAIGSLMALIPPPISSNRFISVFSFSGIIGICGMWNKLRPSWIARLFALLAITCLLLAWAIHCLSFGIIGINIWIWLLPLLLACSIAWILPVITPSWAKAINDEQFNPKSTFGKLIFTIALSLGGASGAIGASIGRVMYKESGFQPVMLIMGIGVSIITIAIAQTAAYQTFTARLQEIENKQITKQLEDRK
jgi:hypothetical protein